MSTRLRLRRRDGSRRRLLSCALLLLATEGVVAQALDWHFADASLGAGMASTHGVQFGPWGEPDMMSGGAAAADIDGDGWVDLFVLRGDLGPARYFRNRHDGTFVEQAAAVGLDISGGLANGAAFGDVDGDGDLDLVLGGISIADAGLASPPRLLRNHAGRFAGYPGLVGATAARDSWSASFGDYDLDGDLDLALAHWSRDGGTGHLWRNRGDGMFDDVDADAGLGGYYAMVDRSFTPNFADLDGDGHPDLLMTGDFGTSRVFRNRGDGGFDDATTSAIDDENGMGAAIGDYDNDGDLDWFVSSIFDPDGIPEGNWGVTGNRLYRNDGAGGFTDASLAAGVRDGGWGWGACFADFDNDRDLDLFQVNGMLGLLAAEFNADTARLFLNGGDGTFIEAASMQGIADAGQGRGVACFDYDRDGDVDVFVNNGYGPSRLYRNDGGNRRAHFGVRLRGSGGNSEGIGAQVTIVVDGLSQMREIGAHNHFLSTGPAEAHFGLGSTQRIDVLAIRWPGGGATHGGGLAAGDHVFDQDTTFIAGFE